VKPKRAKASVQQKEKVKCKQKERVPQSAAITKSVMKWCNRDSAVPQKRKTTT